VAVGTRVGVAIGGTVGAGGTVDGCVGSGIGVAVSTSNNPGVGMIREDSSGSVVQPNITISAAITSVFSKESFIKGRCRMLENTRHFSFISASEIRRAISWFW
jgi:hypothetical protein